jgi:23S rRNA pseudouridine2605 synthase
VRLAKYIALYSSLSRRQAEDAIQSGRVWINGIVADTPVYFVNAQDQVQLDRTLLTPSACVPRLWKCYKPRGCLVTRHDPFGRPTIYDIFSDIFSSTRLVYIGRLDFDSEGLLLLTNTPQIAHMLESPVHQWKRTYRVELQGHISWEICLRMQQPITYEGVTYPGCDVKKDGKTATSTWIRLTLTEGKKREIRNRLAYLGCKVLRLIRVEFAGIGLDLLRPTMWQELSYESWKYIVDRPS